MELHTTAEIFTTEHAFGRQLPTQAFSSETAIKTNVGQSYIDLFCSFEVVQWRAFCSVASRYLVGDEKRTLSRMCQSPDRISVRDPRNEADVQFNVFSHIITPINGMLSELSENETHIFRSMDESLCTVGRTSLKPDFVLVPGGYIDTPERPVVVLEVKTPNVDVGIGLDMLRSSLRSLGEGGKYSGIPQHTLYSFLQIFSYCAHAKTCFGILSSYSQTRFLHIVSSQKIIQVSDVIKYDQIWDDRGRSPHVHQAILYLVHLATSTSEDPARVNMEEKIYGDPSYEGGTRYYEEDDGRHGEESDGHFRRVTRSMTARSVRERERVDSGAGKGGGSCSSRRNGAAAAPLETSSFNIHAILRRASNIPVGHGLTGSVMESTTDDGRPVVVKSASFTDAKRMEHVKNEVEMYKYLARLEGRVIPKMVGCCEERYVTSGSLMLVTEKVGSALVRERNHEQKHGVNGRSRKEGFYVNGSLLDDSKVRRLTKLSLQGLRQIHKQNVLHGDIRCANMQVELCEGEVRRVWWLDFGLSEYCTNKRRKNFEEEELLGIFDRPAMPYSPI